jgi:hypothetical protein
MTKTLLGRVHGKTIELAEELDVPDGQEVEVVVRTTAPRRPWGEGIRRSAGIAAETPGVEEAFQTIERERKAASFRESSE